jgi:hypothetical protein
MIGRLMFDSFTLGICGLALAVVGVIFLANAMGVRRPRRFIQEYFGIQRKQHLRGVLEQLRSKAEIFVGFLFLMAGFSLQIVDELSPALGPPPAPGPTMLRLQLQAFLVLAAGVLAVTIVLRVACHVWSLALFRSLLHRVLHQAHRVALREAPAGHARDRRDPLDRAAPRRLDRRLRGPRARRAAADAAEPALSALSPTRVVRGDELAPLREVGRS